MMSNKPLLEIELENETAVPKVFYKGESHSVVNRIERRVKGHATD